MYGAVAPAPVNVIRGGDALWQTVLVPLTVAVGSGRTTTSNDFVPRQAFDPTPLTVYVVVTSGATLMTEPVFPPGCQL